MPFFSPTGQAIRLPVRERAQDDRVHDAEDDRGRADPQRQAKQGSDTKAGGAKQASKGIADVLAHTLHRTQLRGQLVHSRLCLAHEPDKGRLVCMLWF